MNIPTVPQSVVSAQGLPSQHRAAPAAPGDAGNHPFAVLMQNAHPQPRMVPSQLRAMASSLSAQAAMNHSR